MHLCIADSVHCEEYTHNISTACLFWDFSWGPVPAFIAANK